MSEQMVTNWCAGCQERQAEIERLREALIDYLRNDEACEGNGYGCYTAAKREELWALVGREGR